MLKMGKKGCWVPGDSLTICWSAMEWEHTAVSHQQCPGASSRRLMQPGGLGVLGRPTVLIRHPSPTMSSEHTALLSSPADAGFDPDGLSSTCFHAANSHYLQTAAGHSLGWAGVQALGSPVLGTVEEGAMCLCCRQPAAGTLAAGEKGHHQA